MMFTIALTKLAALADGVQLQPHQLAAVQRAQSMPTGGQILNWRVGGGKTPGTIAIAESRGGNVLAVVPASLRENYRGGVKQFATADRHNNYTVISYEQFAKDPHGWIDKVKPSTVVADEFHRLRNHGKARQSFESVREKIPYMVGATGSLINNRPEELVPLVNLAAGKSVYKSQADFSRRHLKTRKVRKPGLMGFFSKERGTIEEAHRTKELGKRMGPYVHRFSGTTEFMKNFPSVKEQEVRVNMTPHQEKLYNSILNRNPGLASKIKNNMPPNKRELQNLNAFSVALRQISNDPSSFDTSVTDKIKASPKFQRMISEQQKRMKKDPHFRGVVYSGFLGAGVDPVINAARERGIKATTFTGGLNDKQRKQTVDDFNSGKLQVLGLSPAGSEGLDLKGVRLIQLAEGHWNPERSSQAIGRGVRFKSHLHLHPQHRDVMVQRYLAVKKPSLLQKMHIKRKETSIDEWIENRRQEKDRLNQEFLGALG